eukprot:PITA_08870
MEGRRGGSSTPSYKEAIASRGKKHLENVIGTAVEGNRNTEEEIEGTKTRENNNTKEKEEEEKNQGTKYKKQKGPCKPKAEITPRVVLNDPTLQWKPKGSIDLHIGSKGFVTVVFTNIEDKGRVFEGVPYFYAATSLYMRPWMMNFVPECETFSLVPAWVRLYSLPLDYLQTESLATIGNKFSHFVKVFEATKRGKYTSFARICVEMDLSGALLDEIILEVFDEEWVRTVDYEHIPFKCRRCHEHGHLFIDYPPSKL